MLRSTGALAVEAIRCRRCAFAPRNGQLCLFDPNSEGGGSGSWCDGAIILDERQLGWPAIETSYCGRVGFWRERTPAVFGNRSGVGPLVVMPDTNLLIEIREQLDEVEGALILHPLWSAREDPIDALRDLVQLWWWRDLRFVVSPKHLSDSRKPLTSDRKRAREDAVRELQRDYLERGGLEAVVAEEVLLHDEPCALHSVPPINLRSDSQAGRQWDWPSGKLDRILVEAAYDEGCHVFLTADKAVLRSHGSLFPKGLAVLRPDQLLQALEDSGELEATRGGHFLIPDLSMLSRLYAGFADF